MSSKAKKLLFGTVLFFIGYFWFRGTLFLDPDFGWHLRMGQLILQGGIPVTDPFSYTMPSYPVVRHEWLTEIIIAKGMETIGYTGLAALFSVIAVGAFVLQLFTLSPKAKPFAWLFLILVFVAISGLQGVRTQMVTWLLFSGVLFVIRDAKRLQQFGLFLPLLFLFWVNLHGGFASGMIVLVLASIYWWYSVPAKRLWIVSILLGSLAATFVTPYGYRSWWEVWMTMSDSNLRWNIQEWIPTIFVPSLPFWAFVVFSFIFVTKYFKRFSLLDRILYLVLFFLGLSSIRHAPLWVLIALPMTIEAVSSFYHEITTIKYAKERFRTMAKLFFVVVLFFFVIDARSVASALGFFGKQGAYPERAIPYLSKNQSEGQIFSIYEWGGYLIWKLPEAKVFIDGRMPVWRRDGVTPGESSNAFVDYQNFLDGTTPFAKTVAKYNIDTLVLPVVSSSDVGKVPFEEMTLHIYKNILHLPVRKNIGVTHITTQAKKAGWVVVYRDNMTVIYRAVHD